MAKTYTAKQGDTIQDAAFNVAGSLAGIDPILEKNTPDTYPPVDWKRMEYREEVPDTNFMESYTPALRTDQILDVEGVNVDNLEATQGMPFNSSLDNPVYTEFEIKELTLATELQGRGVASALNPKDGGFVRLSGTFLPATFYANEFTVQVAFVMPQIQDATNSTQDNSRVIFDTNGASIYPRFDIGNADNPTQRRLLIYLYGQKANPYVMYGYLYNFTIINDGSGTIRSYLNGELFMEIPDSWRNYSSSLNLGIYYNKLGTAFQGEVLLSRFFNRPLDIEEMVALNNDGLPHKFVVPPTMKVGCVAEYIPQNIIPNPDDDNAGTIWLDSSKAMPQDGNAPILLESMGGYDLTVQFNPAISHREIYSPNRLQVAVNSNNEGFFQTPYPQDTNGFLDGDYTVQLMVSLPVNITSRGSAFNLGYNNISPRFSISTSLKCEMVVGNYFVGISPNMYDVYNLCWVHSGDTVTLYNGDEKLREVPYLTGRDNYFSIGGYSGQYYYPNNIYGVRIFDRAFTQEEISVLWNGKRPQEYVVPASLKQSCIREYLPMNINPLTTDPDSAYSWWSSHNVMPNAEGILEPMQYPPAQWPNINLNALGKPKIIKL